MEHLVERERLVHAGHPRLVQEPSRSRTQRIAGDEDDAAPEVGVPALYLPVEAWTIQLGHPEVRQHEVIGPGAELVERDPAVGGDVHVATGTVNEKVAPCPGALSNRMEPPFPSMMP